MADREETAIRNCDMCGKVCQKYWTRCRNCRGKAKFDAAKEIGDDGGPYFVFGGDQYYWDIADAIDDGVEWLAPCIKTYPRIVADNVLDCVLDDMHEDASVDDLNEVEAFHEAVAAFNEAQTARSYWPDETRKIRVPLPSYPESRG
ncbi:MAG: hypothetical protein AAFW97_13145 [Pseudomonadota bacterium]